MVIKVKTNVILSRVKIIKGSEIRIIKNEVKKLLFFDKTAKRPINIGIILDKKLPNFFSSPNIPVIIVPLIDGVKNKFLPNINWIYPSKVIKKKIPT